MSEKKEVTVRCNTRYISVGKDLSQCKDCDHKDDIDCSECEGSYGGCVDECDAPAECQVHLLQEIDEKEKAIANIEKMAKSKEIEAIKDSLCEKFGINKEELDTSFSQFMANIQNDAEANVTAKLSSIFQAKIDEVIEGLASTMINDLFTKAIEEKVLQFATDANCITSIQQYTAMRVKKFFDDSWDTSKRRDNVLKDTLDQVIKNVAEGKTDQALKEISKESIEKFNIEMMKTMMKGMAKQLGDNPKLLQMMGLQD